MNELVTINGKQVVTSSRNVAEHFEKEHKHVLDSIRAILAAENSAAKFFHETTYENRGKQYPEYLMNRDGFALLVMGFTGKAALEWKMKYIDAFNAMEKSIKTPQLAPNPHYRTRMIGTAVRDIGKTAESIERVFAVKHGMALASAMEMVGESYGIDTAPLKRLIPAEENPGYLNATMLAGKLGLLSKTGNPKASDANAKLAELGLQKKEGKEWRLTDKGREYGEEKPFTRNGHSGYNIGWNEKVLVLFEQPVKV
ncbi:Rha family transcriptional regulator [uncultured Selenomonas sp.]|uniref:Rha family transcriptional regulator n=1 Tax=uncultured Selenomonas sp. TaxID=159275 RepID=UPI0025EEC7C7|nr:Rha family transcriptional regulator [uncultured Selenomonas sp.]